MLARTLPAKLRQRVAERRALAAVHDEMGRVLGPAARDDRNLVARPCPSCGARAPEGAARLIGAVYFFHACSACGMVYAPKLLRPEVVRERFAGTPLARAYHALVRETTSLESYRPQAARLAAAAPRRASAIDVGCGHGAFAAALREQFASVIGLELDPELAEVGRRAFGVDVRCARLEELAVAPASCDLVTMNQILEHVDDARPLIAAAHRLLTEAGVLWISVPQGASLGVALLGGRHPLVGTHQHVNLFSPTTLRALVERAGFCVESLRSDDDPGLPLPTAPGLALEKGLRFAAARTGLVSRLGRGACLELVARRV